ncbi:TPA: hypothetical protein ACXN37_000168 [Stenotrophomonas maltophilia]|uniref:hypothetical protein n=1 Tax=Stenotrophomonas maltophilia TaxID=40324 RepID=UPI0013DA930F|nr:hypothetical protein [Stenotrophomonas maltophilia]MBN5162390.1 hypothetical protein [Stenotrophomonas maltophilia]
MDAIERRALIQLGELLKFSGGEGELQIGREFGKALIAEIAALTPQWQPIESAPKGQEVLVWRPDQGVFIAMIATPDMVMSERDIEECCLPEDFEEWYCEAWGWLEDDLRPTRWMPKPAEPEVEG